MRCLLDGSDWQAYYFLDDADYQDTRNFYNLHNMLMDSAGSAGFHAQSSDVSSYAYKATVPGCDRTVLEENGEIKDMYFGRNLERTEWSEKKGWAFRKEFILPEKMRNDAGIYLTFQSLGYKVYGFVNDHYMGTHCSIFIPWTTDISDWVYRDGRKNVVSLIFAAAPIALPNHHKDRPADFANYQLCQMSFGWDWSRHLVPTGILDHVELHSVKNVRVADAHYMTSSKNVSLEIELNAREDEAVPVEITLTPKNCKGKAFRKTIKMNAVAGEIVKGQAEFEYNDAQFWYPNGYGEQPLYELKIAVPGDEKTWQVSFKDQKMVRNPGLGEDAYPLTFEFNGKRIFARGSNWVPADLVLCRPDGAGYERLVRLAAAQGFNLFRVWGGGILEKEEFYDACDRHGIMVWQEFPHACSAYPCDPIAVGLRKRAAEAFIRRSRNHPSMSLYCGGNEFQYYNESLDNPIYLSYQKMVAEMAPDKPYHFSSPDLSRPGERDHGPWNFKEHEFWNGHFRNLASELGCEGFCESESIDRFIPQNDPLPSGQHWKYHFSFDDASRSRSFSPIVENFNLDCKGRWEAAQASMFTQGAQIAYIYAHYRALFPRNCGCFVWQYNDSWPDNGFSIVDYYTMPKMAHYMIGRSNASSIIMLEDKSWRYKDGKAEGKLKLVCDAALKNVVAKCSVETLDGKVIVAFEKKGSFEAGVHEIGEISAKLPKAVLGNLVVIRLSIEVGSKAIWNDERIYGVPDFRQAFHLPDAKVSVKKVAEKGKLHVTIKNTGKIALVNVRLSAEDVDFTEIFWKQNYITIMPGEERTIDADYTGKAPKKIALHAWNLKKTVF